MRFNFVWAAALVGIVAASSGPASAHSPGHREHRAHVSQPATAETPSTRAYKAAQERMMRGMAARYTGDPDVDFRIQMIPHHQGAIDMARVALAHAEDPWTRQLAEAVIVEQSREIAEMRAWLGRRGVEVPADMERPHVIGASSFRTHDEEPGTKDEARGQSWSPSSGIRRP